MYTKEKCWIAETLGIKQNRIQIDTEHPCGELVIFIDGEYNGYLDDSFYLFMEKGIDLHSEFEDWINTWRDK
tara:strand:+ start:16396 stop:16611 length:216 start_codon:yes stop_codon:yes gene_type:complete